jgi:hypothetical protein
MSVRSSARSRRELMKGDENNETCSKRSMQSYRIEGLITETCSRGSHLGITPRGGLS